MTTSTFNTIAKRTCRYALIAILAMAALGVVLSWSINWYCVAPTPLIDKEPAILHYALSVNQETRSIQSCWLKKEDQLYRMVLKGDPFSRGYANAVLTQNLIREQEASLLDTVRTFVPSPIALWLLTKYVVWRNRDLPDYVEEAFKLEIYGLSKGYIDPFPEIGPLYHRLLNYHAAHDISHAVMDNPLVGCTSFAAWGDKTRDSHLLLGRNFDFDAGRCFDVNKIVMRVYPDQGLGFISVAWPGMIGVVSGLNEALIAITINALQTTDTAQVGTPVSLVIRKVLGEARSIQEAVRIIEQSQVFVSDSYLIADGKSGEAVVVEKTPQRCAVRRPAGSFIVSSNHAMMPELAGDERNLKYMAEGTTVDRYNRMEALIAQESRGLTPETAATILRDRTLPNGVADSYGNAAAVNGLLATHSVIIDATEGLVWVSQGPHQLGAFLPFGLKEFEHPEGAVTIPPDPILASGAYARHVKANDLIRQAEELLSDEQLDPAAELLAQAVALSPRFYWPPLLLGKIAHARNDPVKTKYWLDKALNLYPAYAGEREEIQKMLAEATSWTPNR